MRFIKLLMVCLFLGWQLHAAIATPVSLTSVSRTSNVVTATCAAACNIAANQGFVIAGVTNTSFNVAGTAVTAPTSTTFTFNQVAANASSSGGTVAPAKQVIVLAVTPSQTGIVVNYLLWLTTTQGVTTTTASLWSGVSSVENTAILAGLTVEFGIQKQFPNGMTKAAIQTELQLDWSAKQTALAAGVQPGQFFGGFFDGFGWSF